MCVCVCVCMCVCVYVCVCKGHTISLESRASGVDVWGYHGNHPLLKRGARVSQVFSHLRWRLQQLPDHQPEQAERRVAG